MRRLGVEQIRRTDTENTQVIVGRIKPADEWAGRSNQELQQFDGGPIIISFTEAQIMKWFEQVERIPRDRILKMVLTMKPSGRKKRRTGRPMEKMDMERRGAPKTYADQRLEDECTKWKEIEEGDYTLTRNKTKLIFRLSPSSLLSIIIQKGKKYSKLVNARNEGKDLEHNE